jgi:hypothetical protein
MTLNAPVLTGPPVPQICQRCRQPFPGDPTLLPAAITEWWACPACRASLGLGVRR